MSQNKNWQIKKLDDVCRKLSLNKLKIKQKQYLPKGLFPVIDQGQDLIGGYYNDESLLVSDEPPYIVFGDHTKIKKFIPFRFIPGADGVKVLKPKENILAKFLYYLLFSIKIEDKGYARHFQLLEKETFLIPHDLETQNLIVSKIEELFSELDKGIEDLKTSQQQLKTYRQSVLKWAFEGKLTNKKVKDGELPKGWDLYKLGEYIENISSGKSFRCDERPPNIDEVGIVKVSSVSWGFFDELQSKTCFSKDLLNEKYLIKKGDFLFSRANTIELIGSCIIVHKIEKTLMLSDKILRFIFAKDISKEYVLYYLRSRKGRKQIESLSTGNQDSMRNIGQEKIRQIEFPYCLVEEQHRIVHEIESRLSVADKMEESIAQSLLQAEALRQSILKKAFSGELV